MTMTTTTAWAVVSPEGKIILNTISDTQAGSITLLRINHYRIWAYEPAYACIPVTIKPKEDGE